jgi:hypothetical protein
MVQRLRLDISDDRWERLMEIAVAERRPVSWQAEVLLMRAIDEYFVPMLRPAEDAALIGKGIQDDA